MVLKRSTTMQALFLTFFAWTLSLSALSAELQNTACIDICDHGAIRDGSRLTTEAVQKSIDLCAAGGGGRVYVPPGEYLIGTIVLRDNVELYVAAGATLRGSVNMSDYNQYLIRADGAQNIAISGRGCIDGSGAAFWEKKESASAECERLRALGGWVPAFDYTPKFSPNQMIRLTRCERVSVSDVLLKNSPGWTLHLLACDHANIRGITIRNPFIGSNTDGIDIDACRDVRVSDCDISTGDDAIVLKNTDYEGLKRTQRDIAITHCLIDTTCNAFKIGTETTADFENISFSNSIINSNGEFGPLAGIAIETVDGANVRGVSVNNIVMHGARAPIFMRLGNRGRGQTQPSIPGTLSDVVIDNIIATGTTLPSPISGLPGHAIRNVSISNVRIETNGSKVKGIIPRKIPEVPGHYPESLMFGRLPAYGFYCRHIDGLTFQNVSVSCDNPEKRKLLVSDDVKNLRQQMLRRDQ